jgi:hypothetical protein
VAVEISKRGFRPLLACGLLSSVLYVATDIVGSLSYRGYDYAGQSISEMSAIGAPTASMLVPFYLAYSVLVTAFGCGLWSVSYARTGLRRCGGLVIAVGLLGFAWPEFPMHMRGQTGSFTDTMHLALGGLDSLLIGLAMAFGAGTFGRPFRIYTWSSIALMLTFGAATSTFVPGVDAGAATPGLGILERLCLGTYLLWFATLSVMLLRAPGRAS